jgi:hypothetical protein
MRENILNSEEEVLGFKARGDAQLSTPNSIIAFSNLVKYFL